MLKFLRSGDTVVVIDLTRLSRSTKDLIEIAELISNKGAILKSLKESWLDTTTAHGKMLFTVFAGIAQFERDLTSERTYVIYITKRNTNFTFVFLSHVRIK